MIPTTKVSDNVKIVEWSDEDRCFIGYCPEIIGPCCHGDDEAEVYRQLCQIVAEWRDISFSETRKRYGGSARPAYRASRPRHESLPGRARGPRARERCKVDSNLHAAHRPQDRCESFTLAGRVKTRRRSRIVHRDELAEHHANLVAPVCSRRRRRARGTSATVAVLAAGVSAPQPSLLPSEHAMFQRPRASTPTAVCRAYHGTSRTRTDCRAHTAATAAYDRLVCMRATCIAGISRTRV